MVLSPSNKSSDAFIERLDLELTRLREMDIEVTVEGVICFHSLSTGSQIVDIESSKDWKNEARQRSFQLCTGKKYEQCS